MSKARKISKKYYLRQIIGCWLACWMVFGLPVQIARATPSNPNVVAGTAGVGQSGNTTTVNMGSAQAVINWDSLNTSSNEILQFLKAGGSFAVLNRVIQGGATQFDGSLFGNQGHIIIVNPHGIVFGPTSLVQAYKFTASALDIADADFMKGIYKFDGGGIGEVANYGNISAEQVALIGKKVLNAGTITSPGGYVLMAAGDSVFLGAEGSDIVVEVAGVTMPQEPPVEGLGDVINEGTIEAAGGKIVLAAGDTFSRAVEGLDGLSVAVDGGTGRVGQFGTLSADGVEGDGGSITLTAGDVVALGSDSVTTANAGTNGDGGEVIVYSPETALFRSGAQIEAKGGSESGDGGFVEVSGKEYLEFEGHVDTSAVAGKNGTLLIDPTSLEVIITGGAGAWMDHLDSFFYDPSAGDLKLTPATIIAQLVLSNVLLLADDLITVTDAIIYAVANHLKLETTNAGSSIVVNAPITNSLAGDVTLNVGTGGSIDLNADLSTLGTLSGNATIVNVLSNIAQIQDAIDIAAAGATANVSAGTYTEDVTIDKDVTLNGAQAGVDARGRSASESEIVGVVEVTSDAADVVFDGLKFTSPTRAYTPRGFNLHIESESSTVKNNIFVAEENAGHTYSGYLDFLGITNAVVEKNEFSGDLDPTQTPNVIALGISGAGTVTVSNNEMHDVGGGGGVGIMSTNAGAVINIEDNEMDNTGDGIWVWSPGTTDFDTLRINSNYIHNSEKIGVKIVGAVAGGVNVTLSGNEFENNDVQVLDAPEVLNIQDVLDENIFDRAVVIDRPGSSLLYTIWSNIQDAIDSAQADDTVEALAGTYNEQVEIDKSLVLQGAGAGSSIIEAPSILTGDASGSKNIVTITGSGVNAEFAGFTVDGAGSGNDNGIYVRDEAYADIHDNTLTDPGYIGIQVGRAAHSTTGTATLSDNIISGYVKGGIVVDNVGSSATITGNTTTGVGPTVSIAQNGIQVSRGATGTITGNTVSGHVWTGTYGGSNDPATDPGMDGAAGILLYHSGSSVSVDENILTENQFGIWTVGAADVSISDNEITGASASSNVFPTGIAVFDSDQWTVPLGFSETGTTASITGNIISTNSYGLLVSDYTAGGVTPSVDAHYNSISGNSSYGAWSNVALDASANWWGDATGPTHATSNPTGSGDAVSDNADFSPWYGIGDDVEPLTPGFQPFSPMSWGMLGTGSGSAQDWIDNYASDGDTLNLDYSEDGTVGDISDGDKTININITAGGTLTVDGKVDVDGSVDLGATGDVIVNGSIDPDYVDIQAGNIWVNALISAIDYIILWAGTDGTGDVTVDHTGSNEGSLETTAPGSDITITAGTDALPGIGNISLLGDATIETQDGVGSGHEITLTAWDGAIAMDDGSLIDARDGKIAMSATGGNITLGGLLTTSDLADAVTIDTSAAVVDAGSLHVDIKTGATGGAVINAVTGVGSAPGFGADPAIETTVASLEAHSTGVGDIVIDETDGITLTDVDTAAGNIDITASDLLTATAVEAGGSGNVSLTTSSGNVVVTDVKAVGNQVTIDSAGSILSSGPPDTAAELTAVDLLLDAVSGIGAGAGSEVETDADNLNASVSGAGDIDILEKDGIVLTAVDTTNGAITITTDGPTIASNVAAGGGGDEDDVTITAVTGDITVGSISTQAFGDVILEATADSILNDGSLGTYITAETAELDAKTNIGQDVTFDISNALDLKIKRLDAEADDGSIYVRDYDGNLRLDSVLAKTAGQTIYVQNDADNGKIVVGTVTADTAAGTVQINASGVLGSIVDDSVGGTYITAKTADLDADADIGELATALNTKIDNLNADTIGGSIYLTNEAGGLSLVSVSAAVDAEIENTTTGDIVVDTVTVGGTATITATDGAITDADPGTEVAANIAGTSAVLTASSGVGAAGDADIDTDVDTLEASTSTGGIYVEDLSGDLTIAGAGAQVTGAGEIVIAAASPLSVSSAVSGPGNITLTAGGSIAADDDLTLSANVTSTGTGTINLTAGDDIIQDAGTVVSVTGGGAIDASADVGDADNIGGFTQAEGASFVSNGEDITVSSKGDAAIALLDAGTGDVVVASSGGEITDNTTTVETANIKAASALLIADTGIGGSDIDTEIDNLEAATATGGIYVTDLAGDLTIGGIEVATEGVQAGSGDIELETPGLLSVTEVVSGTGPVTINGSTVDLDADLDGTLGGDNTTINVLRPDNGAQIQDAIDIAADGAGIDVSAGTYNEKITIDKDNLTIQSTDGAATTIITPTDTTAGGIWLTGSGNTFDGFTVQDFSDTSGESKIIRIHNNADDNIIINNIIQGNLNQVGVVDQTVYGILCYGSDNLIQGNEISDIGDIGINVVGPPHSGASNNTISGNNVHDIGFYAIAIDRSPGNTITGNTISNLVGGNLSWGIIVWGEAADGTQIIDQVVSGLPNGIILSSAHNTLVQGGNISNNIGVGLKVAESGWAGGVPTGNQIVGNNINNNDVGVEISGNIGVGNVFHENSIAGNPTFGMDNTSGTKVDAIANWWGDEYGPQHTTNPYTTTGNPVSGDVDYNPWWADVPGTEPMPWRGIGTGDPGDAQDLIDLVGPGGSLELMFTGFVSLGALSDGGNNIDLTIISDNGLNLDGKVAIGGEFNVDAEGQLIINAEIDPDVIWLQAGDIDIFAPLIGDNLIYLEAGTGGVGDVTIDHTGSNAGSLETTFAGSDIEIIAGSLTSGDIELLGDATITTSGAGPGHVITLTANSGEIAMDNGSLINAGDGEIDMDATGGNVTLGGLLTTSVLADAVTINTSADVIDGGDTDVDILAATGGAVINAATGIGAAGAIDTTVATLEAHTAAGNVVIDETDNITLADVDTVNGSIDITSGANIELDDAFANVVSAGTGDVSLTAADSITVVDATTQTEIANTGSVTLTAKAVGATNPLDLVGAASLIIDDLDGAGQDMIIREQTASSILRTEITVATPAAGDIDITFNNTDSVAIDEGHILTNVNIGNGVSDFIYTATTGDITVDTVNTDGADTTITATAGAISGVLDDATADVAGATVTLVAGSGNIRGDEAGDALDVTATAALNADTTGSGGDIVIDSIGNLPVGLLNAGNGDVTVDSTGAINDDAADAPDIIAYGLTTLTAQGAIGDSDAIETRVDTLNASAAAGVIDIAEEDGIFLADIETTAGAITVSSTTGDIEVGAISAGAGSDSVSLTATNGSIVDDGFAGTYLFAGSADLDAGAGNIGASGAGDSLVTRVDTLDATASGSIYIAEDSDDITLNTISAGTTGAGEVDIFNIDGDIIVDGTISAAGDIYLESDEDDIIVSATGTIDLDGSNGSTLMLEAGDDILIEGPIADSTPSDDAVHVMLFADDGNPGDTPANIRIADSITTGGGNFNSSGTTFDNTGGIINTEGTPDGSINISVLNETDKVSLGADLNAGAQTISGNAALIDVLSNDARIQDGIDVARPAGGATITVLDDTTYTENLSIYKPDITLQSGVTDTVTLTAGSGDVLSITAGAGNFTLGGASDQGFTVATTGVAVKGVSASDTTGLTISYNEFTADNDDTSIEAQDVVDLLINNNTFTATSATGVDLAGVTGSSAVQSNVIDNYDIGIKVSNGTGGTDGLSISGNDILNNTTGILFTQGAGISDTQNVTVQNNMLVGDDAADTGLKVEDGDHVLADTFTIQYNGFEGHVDATGLANEHTTRTVTAEKNWWDAADGPDGIGTGSGVAVTEVVLDSVDYSPWLGIGDAEPSIRGFQVASPMIWWTNDSLQEAIDAASTTVVDTIVAMAGTYNELGGIVNVDKQLGAIHFIGPVIGIGPAPSEVDAELKLTNGDAIWDEGLLLMDTIASIDETTPDFATTPSNQNLTLNLVTDEGEHSLTLDTGSGIIDLNGDVTVGEDLTLMSDTVVAAEKTLHAGEYLVLAAGENMTGEGTLTLKAGDGNIILGAFENPGNVSADGPLTMDASFGSIYAYGTITTTSGVEDPVGHIHLSALDSTIHLYGNVTADVDHGGDIFVHNASKVSDNVTIKAGDDVTIEELMIALGNLTIEAGDLTTTTLITGNTYGEIQGGPLQMPDNAFDPYYTLTLRQNADLDMEPAFGDVTNSDDTHLVAQSTAGSVTSAQADTWLDIKADAHIDIRLDDGVSGGEIRTLALNATTGDVLITSDLDTVRVNGQIYAGRDVKITGKDDFPYGIYLNHGTSDPDIKAFTGDIWLNNNTQAVANVELVAGQDVRVGFDQVQNYYLSKTLTGLGNLTVQADRHITFGGPVEAAGLLTIRADADYFPVPPAEDGGNMWAKSSLTTTGVGSDMLVEGRNILVEGSATSSAQMDMYASDDATLEDDVTATGDIDLFADWDVPGVGYENGTGDLTVLGDIESTGGSIEFRSDDDTTTLSGDKIEASVNITLHDNTVLNGTNQRIEATNGKVVTDDGADVHKVTAGNLDLNAGSGIELGGDLLGYDPLNPDDGITASDTITFESDVTAYGTGDQRLDAGDGSLLTLNGVDIDKTIGGNLNLGGDGDDNIKLGGNVRGTGLGSSDAITFEDDVTANATDDLATGGVDESDQRFDAYGGKLITQNTIDIDKTTTGDLYLGGDEGIELGGYVDVDNGSLTIEDDFSAAGDLTASANVTFDGSPVNGILDGIGNQRIDAEGGELWANGWLHKTTEGDLTLAGETGINLDGYVDVDNGSLTIEDDFSAAGDLLASANVTFDSSPVNGEFDGIGDQKVDAQTGTLTANGWLHKGESSLYLEAAGNVSLADYITADSGGVSIVSETGTIFTPGGGDDTLNVTIMAYSDQADDTGVELPQDSDQKAAIVIISADTLNLGPGAELIADGVYDTTGDVDDRAAVGFLDTPATIGGVPRDEGDPFDAAIYLASTSGNVDVSSPVEILSFSEVPEGAMIVDAYNTVTFGPDFETSLAGVGGISDVGDRLEVASRITEWLYQAVGRLPYAGGGGPFPLGYDYVLRGAGLANPSITDGRAWVLENPTDIAPLYTETGENAEEQTLGVAGCPALIAAAADEIGVPQEELNVSMATATAAATDIQPCDSCARLIDAAAILRDEDGSRMAAMVQTFNALAPADAPFTPEMATSIATAFEGVAEGTQYASTMEYVDAFVQYVAVLDTEMGSPVDDSLAFVMGKYGEGITENENSNIAALIATRLESLETFGN